MGWLKDILCRNQTGYAGICITRHGMQETIYQTASSGLYQTADVGETLINR